NKYRDIIGRVNFTVIHKGWGHELIYHNNKDYCAKELFFIRGKRCSAHLHNIKDELFICIAGEIFIEYSMKKPKDELDFKDNSSWCILKPGDSFHVPVGLVHRITGLSDINRIHEFSTFDDPVDSIRLIKGD
ncbi:MAG: hypothetical protein AABW56_02240, partial [Nanoarchaeota archaeon]